MDRYEWPVASATLREIFLRLNADYSPAAYDRNLVLYPSSVANPPKSGTNVSD